MPSTKQLYLQDLYETVQDGEETKEVYQGEQLTEAEPTGEHKCVVAVYEGDNQDGRLLREFVEADMVAAQTKADQFVAGL